MIKKTHNKSKRKSLNTKEMRIQIIEAATDLFMSEGLYNVTMQQIAKQVEITQPAIYRHFKDMDDIFLSACKHWVSSSVNEIRPDEERLNPPWIQLTSYVERHLTYAQKHRSHDGLLLGLYYYSMRSQEMFAFYKETKTRAILHLSLILKIGTLEAEWKIDHLSKTAETIHSLVVAEVIKLLIEPKAESTKSLLDRIMNHIRLLVGETSATK